VTSRFSRIGNAEQIVQNNLRPAAIGLNIRMLLTEAALRSGPRSSSECVHQ